MPVDVIHLADKFAAFDDEWSPRVIAQMNDYHIKLVKVRGDFVWHRHAETDEVFLVFKGALRIEFRDGSVELGPGDLCVVPRGVEHKPTADEDCHLLLVEPGATPNTGDAGGERTAQDTWI